MKDARTYIIEGTIPKNIDLMAGKITYTDKQVVAIVEAVVADAEGFIEDRDNKITKLEGNLKTLDETLKALEASRRIGNADQV